MCAHSVRAVRSTRLDRETRLLMEHGLGEDFHRVTLSVREGAGGPVAYTVGEHIVISARWYRPDTWLGRFVLAHELAHVVQKRRGSSSAVGGS